VAYSGGACGTLGRDKVEKPEINHLGDLSVDMRIILKWLIKE
jgi:hypothetical protein